ncbi:MAG: S-layer homology domain-containing protein, partial [Clostridia bacterium]|nr:S-layer homology domain-containing protein [Clostridia bacterium]
YDQEIEVTWDPQRDVGEDKVVGYSVYCINEDCEIDLEFTYSRAEAPFSHRFEELVNNESYEVGVMVEYQSGYTAEQWINATPYALAITTLTVGDAVVVENGILLKEEDDGWSYDGLTNTLLLSYADITDGYEHEEGRIAGIYADGDLNISLEGGENYVTAPDLTGGNSSAEMLVSSGIYAMGVLSIEGTDGGKLTTTGGKISGGTVDAVSSGIVADRKLSVYGVEVTAAGGDVTVAGEGAAYSAGVYVIGDLDVDFDGELTAVGGTVSGDTAYSSGLEAYGSEDVYINVAVYTGEFTAVGGKATGITRAGSNGVFTKRGGLYTFEGGAKVALTSGEATATSENEADSPYAYSNGIYVQAGDVGIRAGSVAITGGSWSGLEGDGYAVIALSEQDEYGLSGGNVEFDLDSVAMRRGVPGLLLTNVEITAEDGYAVYAQAGLDIREPVIVTAPEGGVASGVWEEEPGDAGWTQPDYYTIVDGEGEPVSSVSLGVQTYDVYISGLSYERKANVPATWSLNETYCQLLDIDDFSEAMDLTKEGYTFVGWYDDNGVKFTFDDPVEREMTIYAKWRENSDAGDASSDSDDDGSFDERETTKNEDGSTTTTVTNKETGVVTETTRTPEGVTGTVVTNKKGKITQISAKVPAAAAKDGKPVVLPIEMEAADSADEALEIRVKVPETGAVVEIPVENVTAGTVAVLVEEDGTEKVIKTSAITENGVMIALEESCVIKIVDNSKEFDDVHAVGHWAERAVDFVVSRGIYSGTSETTFHPENSMTRGMLAVALHNLESNPDHSFIGSFADAPEGAWYTEAIRWAAEQGIVSGYGNGFCGAQDALTREQLVTILWSYAKYKGFDVSVGENTNILSYNDAFDISEYAIPAMQWACGAGVLGGRGDGTLDPCGTATRAEVAQMLMNFLCAV